MNIKMRKIMCLLAAVALTGGCKSISTAPASAPVVTPTPEVEKRVSFLGVGDNLIHNSVYWQADANAPGADFDFTPMYEYVAEDVAAADISYINQETIIGGTEIGLSSYPLFNSPQEVARDMKEIGFDVFSHATNHVFDKGERGLANTYAFYEKNPDLTCIGLYRQGEDTIKVLEKEGVKIAFINYTYLTNGLSLPKNSEYYVPLADYKNGCSDMTETVKRAKEMADFVVCCLHWGQEGATRPDSVQRESAQLLSEAGCDVIIGTHSHTIQPVEYVGDTLVVYSLGNFISAQKNPVNLLGGMIGFDFVKKGDEKHIENVVFHPVITQYGWGFSNLKIIPFDEYSPELASKHGAGVSYSYFENLINKTISAEFLVSE